MIIRDFHSVQILDRISIRTLPNSTLSSVNSIHIVFHTEDEKKSQISPYPCSEIIGINLTEHKPFASLLKTVNDFKSYPLTLVCETAFSVNFKGELIKEIAIKDKLVFVLALSKLDVYEIKNLGKIMREEQLTHSNETIRNWKYA